MINYISGLVFVILLLVGGAVVVAMAAFNYVLAAIVGIVWLIADVIISSAIKLAAQWQRAVVFRLGKFKDIRGPGLFMIIPLVEQVRMIDTRVLAVHIPKQQVITRDNVPVTIDAALFFRVVNAADAIIMVQDYRADHHAIRPDLAPRRHRPGDPGPTLDRTRADRQGDRSPCRA